MKSTEVRKAFLDYFSSRQHTILPSAPMVIKNDPTLMFTNAGMNQFKDIFLGNAQAKYKRVANSQKCLRVSGKHNDLEEVGVDTYHHTMFEMLGNWSFGDYFKKEAIEYAWEFLTEICKIDQERLYASVFECFPEEHLSADDEAYSFWKKFLPEDRIIYGSKKDNFWEMGETGPCGPCSEIHIDLRSDEERKKNPGNKLVNQGHPLVIEIWNLVFIQYNRKSDGSLENLPDKHIDTGMGFERLCMALQGKQSNYDTDIFQPLILYIAKETGIPYSSSQKSDMAMRVMADHIRAVAFAIADGQLPSNNRAGYVIRRILRRSVRYAYSFLGMKEPFMYKLANILSLIMGDHYPELNSQKELISKVIFEEEEAFLKTLSTGITIFNQALASSDKKGKDSKKISGTTAFQLYDTYGFPIDLTQVMAKENKLEVNMDEFNRLLDEQKNRSREAAATDTEDWIVLSHDDETVFCGYDKTETEISISRYRKVTVKNKSLYHMVFNVTPFYAESGGQVGDTGYIRSGEEKTGILNTVKENNLIIHVSATLPKNPQAVFKAIVSAKNREAVACHHTATHLLHHALRKTLGVHVEQKGSLVHPEYLRFDFSHFSKMSDEELSRVETLVNETVRANLPLQEQRSVSMEKAMSMGAIALFGEKYGDHVRVIRFGDSIELCGGTHISSTGQIGLFKIISESAIAAGIRRIEAVASSVAEKYINAQINDLKQIRLMFKNPPDIAKTVDSLMQENAMLKKQIEHFRREKVTTLSEKLFAEAESHDDIKIIAAVIEADHSSILKDIAYQIKSRDDRVMLALGADIEGKANISVMISDTLVKEKKSDANKIIREISKEIDGSGGGQPFFATAGGKKPDGLSKAIRKAVELFKNS